MKNINYGVLLICLFSFVHVSAQYKPTDKTTDKKNVTSGKTVKINDQEIKIKLGGFVRFESYFDTYKSVDSRDGQIYFYPKKPLIDDNGNDINETNQFGMASFDSRFNIKATGYEILGAKTFAFIEADFFSTAQDYTQQLRLRHAYIKMDWDKASLLMGQGYHPMFVTKCFPKVLTNAVAAPYTPLNRAPQIRFTYKLTKDINVSGTILTSGYHKSKGPADAQRNSGKPEVQFQVMATPGKFIAGATAGYKTLQPRIATDKNFKTDKQIGSFNTQAFAGFVSKKFSIKAMGIYGENLTNFVMIGGYGASADPTITDDYSYSNLRTYSVWGEVTAFANPQIGLFAGFSENLGSTNEYYSLDYARGEDLVKTYRISPRINYTINKFSVGLEYLYSAALYGNTFDEKHQYIGDLEHAHNHRFTLLAILKF